MGRAVEIPLPAVFEPLLQPARYKGVYGGRGGAKSNFLGDQLIDDALTHRGLRAVCIREYQVSLEQSVKRLLEDKITQYGLHGEFRVMDSRIETPGDGIIIFQGMQAHNAESIKSLEGYDRAWVEEAQNLSQRSLDLLRPTIRKDGSELWFSWNPRFETDPVDKFLRKDPPPDAIVVESSYLDNPFLPSVLLREAEWDKSRDLEKYEHIWGGAYEKHSSSRVFKNWKVAEFETPRDAVLYLGGDWGFSVDPSVLIAGFLGPPAVDDITGAKTLSRRLYLPYEAYQVGTEIDYLPKLFDGLACGCEPNAQGEYERPCVRPDLHAIARGWQIIADSARPETISYLQRHGYPLIVPAVKGPNSVKEGVIFLQNFDIVIHPRCKHTEYEFTHYSYVVDKLTNMVTPILEDKKNHVIDSVRYAIERLRSNWVNPTEVGMTSSATW